MSNSHVDVIVLGAGASGLMLAAHAAKRGRSVLILEKANKIGKKILMSGGGKCNFTNLYENLKTIFLIIRTLLFLPYHAIAIGTLLVWSVIMELPMKNVNTGNYLR